MDAAGPGSTRALVGRSAELDDLDEVLATATVGGGGIVLIEGEAGIGKTSLVNAVCASAQLLGIDVRTATARPGRDRPFVLLADALVPGRRDVPDGARSISDVPDAPAAPDGPAARDASGADGEPGTGSVAGRSPIVHELAALLDSLRGSSLGRPGAPGSAPPVVVPGAVATRVEELFAALVRRGGVRAPLLLVLEDLHLADDASLAVLYRLAHEGMLPGVLVLATMRPVPRRAELAAVVAAWTRAGARYVEVRPLTVLASLEVAERMLGARAGASLRGWISMAGGNPRLVVDVVRAARDALVPVDQGRVDVVGQAWTTDLDAVVATRLDYLGPQVVGLLAHASVLGTSFVVGDLAELADEPVTTCWRVLRHALAAGAVHARGDRLVFRHELVRSALYVGLDGSVRRGLHERAARILAGAGAPSVVVQTHRDLAG